VKHVNLTAYEGVESLDRFDTEEFKKYCDSKLESCDKHVAFLKKLFPNRLLKVCEIGSGSGKLLFRLEKEGMLKKGVAYEVSKSRCLFADEFSRYVSSKVVTICNEDFLEANLVAQEFDLVIGIDVVTNLIGAISNDHILKFIAKAKSCLRKKGGEIVLELMTCEREKKFINQSENNIYRTWKRFDKNDPFMFGLFEMSFDRMGNVVWHKQFITRNGQISTFDNILRPVTDKDIVELSGELGMKCEIFRRWATNDDTADEEFVVLFSNNSDDQNTSE